VKRAKTISPVSPNFVTMGTPQKDIDNYITPDDNEPVTTVAWEEDMAGVLVRLHKFPSRGQAIKNGWVGDMPYGFNVWQVGKDQFVTLKGI
jgi:hypothetical protein